jgi:hypothetical protein
MNRRSPDFLIVGAPRSGTSWTNLHLRRHPAIWTPPIKELHYFDVQRRHGHLHRFMPRHLARIWRVILKLPRRRARKDLRENGAWYTRYFLGRRSDDWYLSLFPTNPELICGEATPAYGSLAPDDIEYVLALCPAVKVIFIVREPVDRLLSNIAKKFCRDNRLPFSRMTDEHWATALGFAATRARIYRNALTNWPKAVGPNRFRTFEYDQLKRDPVKFMQSVVSFLGADPRFYDGDELLARPHNSTQGFRDAPVPGHVLSKLRDMMAEERTFLESNGFRFTSEAS